MKEILNILKGYEVERPLMKNEDLVPVGEHPMGESIRSAFTSNIWKNELTKAALGGLVVIGSGLAAGWVVGAFGGTEEQVTGSFVAGALISTGIIFRWHELFQNTKALQIK